MNTKVKELKLNELELANGGSDNPVRINSGIKGICKLVERIIRWFN